MKRYKDLLPSYLDGENINCHASIIDKQNFQIYEKIQLMKLWCNLERPILIEKVQTAAAIATINVHIHSPSVIKKISIKEHPNYNRTYSADEVVTDTIITFNEYAEIPPVMPDVTVTLETFDGLTFQKGYPENDVIKDDIRDHDEFLDIIGTLLNIPRRIYTELDYSHDLQTFEHIYPPFFTKTGLVGHQPGDILTEDDFYYSERLKRFITEYNDTILPVLMCKILYQWDDFTAINMKDVTTSIADDNVEYIGKPVLNIITPSERYRNMDYTNMTEIIRKYSSLTKPTLLSEPKEIYNMPLNVFGTIINRIRLSQIFEYTALPYELQKEGYIAFLPVKVTFNFIDENKTVERIYQTGLDGSFHPDIVGLPPGTVQITTNPIVENEFRDETTTYTQTVNVEEDLGLVVDYQWEYKDYWDYTGNAPLAPSGYGDQVNTGRGYLVYTPIYDTDFLFTDEYKISIIFSYTTRYPRIGFGKLRQRPNYPDRWNTTKMYYLSNYMDTTDFNTPHQMDINILNGVAYFFIDGEYINEKLTIESGLNYLSGYNTLVFEEIQVSTSADITDPPA